MELSYGALVLTAVFCVAQTATVPPQTFDIRTLIKDLQASLDEALVGLRKNFQLPEQLNGETIVKLIHEQSDRTEKALRELKVKLDELKKDPEFAESVKKLEAKIEEGRRKLKEIDPQAAENLQTITDAVKQVYETLGKEFEKTHTEVNKKGGIREDLDNLLKSFIDSGTAAAKDFQIKVQKVVKDVSEQKT